jgi:hypothetical protein
MHLMVKMLFQLPGVIIESQTSQFLSLPLSYRRSTVVCTGQTGQNAVPATVGLLVGALGAMVLTRMGMGRVWSLVATAPPDRRAARREGLLWTPTRIASPPEPLSPPD